ncbi:hypothetical protein [Pelagibius sp. 7325]|uniref:hypothetical protein n=1 Tax=Pelagibius sp. 7325 TaxID=3131994 RepID=UPI0030EBB407
MSGIVDGLDVLRGVLTAREVASLIERTARWVAPETFRLLPVWYPEHARKRYLYNATWTEVRTNTSRTTKRTVDKLEGNTCANKALTLALAMRQKNRPNWSSCHIWGVDDPRYQQSNDVVADPRFYSCVANMVLLPTPLKAFTDTMPEVKAMLRLCAHNLYGWRCDHKALDETNAALDRWNLWDDYPKSWPRSSGGRMPQGAVPLNPDIEKAAKRRLAAIKRDLEHAGPHYPRESVRAVLDYWKIKL